MKYAVLYSLPVIASLGTALAQSADISTVCQEIDAAISSASEVFYPGAYEGGPASLWLADAAYMQRTWASLPPTSTGCPRAHRSQLARSSQGLLTTWVPW